MKDYKNLGRNLDLQRIEENFNAVIIVVIIIALFALTFSICPDIPADYK